ncbi:MAG: tyrosine recombinase XerC [Gammaproteobacteria bacterium]|nr:tyrosine recombinase XerC [Gammaproteobacteria bacterium]
MTSPQLKAQLDTFISYLELERRVSFHTTKNYRLDLERLALHCQAQGIVAWRQLDAKAIRSFVTVLHRQGLSGRSIQRSLSAVRSFFRYLIREGLASINPGDKMSAPKSAKRLPKALTVDQMTSLLESDLKPDGLQQRDQAMLELVYSSGLRLAELIGLDIYDMDLEQGLVRVTGKGAKTRVVPVGAAAERALSSWLLKRPDIALPEEQALFVSLRGTRIHPRTVQQRVAKWAERKGLEQPLHPHMLRHSFASHLLESSGNLRAVQELLGHTDISTTQIYTHLDFQHLAAIYDKSHPRARKKKNRRV